jgi:hypothetical protein
MTRHRNGPSRTSITNTDRLARGLGWFSLALGVTELVAPGKLAKCLGLEGKETLLRAYGAREIAAGMGALSVNPGPALWARVGGDLIDLATIACGLKGSDDQRRNAAIALAAVAGITVVDIVAATAATEQVKRPKSLRSYRDRSGFPNGRPQPAAAS